MVKVYCPKCDKISVGKIDKKIDGLYYFKNCNKCGGPQYEYFKPGSKPKYNKKALFGNVF